CCWPPHSWQAKTVFEGFTKGFYIVASPVRRLMDPLDARAHTAEHFVRVRADGRGNFARLDAIDALLADDHHFVARFHLHVRHIHHDHVHRHRAHNRRAAAANQHRAAAGEAPVEAVRVARGHDRDASRLERRPVGAVSHNLTLPDPFHGYYSAA